MGITEVKSQQKATHTHKMIKSDRNMEITEVFYTNICSKEKIYLVTLIINKKDHHIDMVQFPENEEENENES